jgi:hypothetical protein
MKTMTKQMKKLKKSTKKSLKKWILEDGTPVEINNDNKNNEEVVEKIKVVNDNNNENDEITENDKVIIEDEVESNGVHNCEAYDEQLYDFDITAEATTRSRRKIHEPDPDQL